MTTFALTKIQAPRPRATVVDRGATRERLAEALATRRGVLVCAPAGYGKTTVLAQEVAALPKGHALAWVSADEGDDLPRLLECMLAALEPFDPPWRTAPEGLVQRAARGSADEARAVAAEVINTLDACEAPRGVIVLDDLHRVHDPAFFRFMEALLERLGERWCVALASRSEPPLPLARLRAAGELAEFGQLQLQLAREEARRLAAAEGIDEATADRIFDRTQGWPAGIRMAIGSLRAGGSLRSGERPMADFIATEVLDHLPAGLAEFLLRTSVLPELEAARCAPLVPGVDAAAMLDEIERRGLFVDVLEAPARTLRLHDLFREALQARLRRQDPAQLAEARRRAAAGETDLVRRVALYLEAGDARHAAREVFTHVPPLLATAGPSLATHLLAQFPATERDHAPELAFVRGLVAWIHWDFAAMRSEFERAEAGFAAAGERDGALRSRAYRATALVAIGRLEDAAAALESLRAEELCPEARIVALNAASWLALDTGRLRAVAGIVSEMLDLLEEVERVERVERLDLWYQTSPPNRLPGLPGIAAPLARHAEMLLRVAGEEPTPLRAIGLLAQGWGAAWRGDLDRARSLAELAQRDAAWSGDTGAVRGHLLALTAVLHAMAGEAGAAMEAALARARELRSAHIPWGRYLLRLFAARIAATTGDAGVLRDALRELEAVHPAAATFSADPVHMPVRGELAWLEGRPAEAASLWRQALGHEEAIDMLGQAMETRVRLARFVARSAEPLEAAEILAPVFERARRDGGPGGALLAGDALAELAAHRWEGALAAADLAQLRAWCEAIARGPERHGDLAEPLTSRELEVLQRIAAGDSNKLIARALDLSPHTVKRHVANILAKLGAQTRGQAAAWMRGRPAA